MQLRVIALELCLSLGVILTETGRITSSGLLTDVPRVSKHRDTVSSSNVAIPPDEVLFRRRGAPQRYEENDIYWADKHLQGAQRLPESDLLKAIHAYAADFYEKQFGGFAAADRESLDESALLCLGILIEEVAEQVLGNTGDLAFVEGDLIEGCENPYDNIGDSVDSADPEDTERSVSVKSQSHTSISNYGMEQVEGSDVTAEANILDSLDDRHFNNRPREASNTRQIPEEYGRIDLDNEVTDNETEAEQDTSEDASEGSDEDSSVDSYEESDDESIEDSNEDSTEETEDRRQSESDEQSNGESNNESSRDVVGHDGQKEKYDIDVEEEEDISKLSENDMILLHDQRRRKRRKIWQEADAEDTRYSDDMFSG